MTPRGGVEVTWLTLLKRLYYVDNGTETKTPLRLPFLIMTEVMDKMAKIGRPYMDLEQQLASTTRSPSNINKDVISLGKTHIVTLVSCIYINYVSVDRDKEVTNGSIIQIQIRITSKVQRDRPQPSNYHG